jgi:hypothetical protein
MSEEGYGPIFSPAILKEIIADKIDPEAPLTLLGKPVFIDGKQVTVAEFERRYRKEHNDS